VSFLDRLLPGLAALPDIHPMFVHFPVALFPLALVLACVPRRFGPMWIRLARWTLWLATVSLVVAGAAGFRAAHLVARGRPELVDPHRNLMIAVGAAAGLLVIATIRQRTLTTRGGRVTLVVGLLVVNGLLVPGADRGALVALRLRAGLDLPVIAADIPGREAAPAVVAGESGRERGRTLYRILACDTCHGADRTPESPGIPPTLDFAGSKLRPAWVVSYLRAPHAIRWVDKDVRPTLRMPDFRLTEAEATELAAFLDTRQDTMGFPPIDLGDEATEAEAAERGRDLYAQYACSGCHSIGGIGGRLGPALDDVGSRLRPAYVYAFLRSPREIIPGTPMKDFDLWEDEARELTAFLGTLRSEEGERTW